ncbi:hypothetical protein [Prauserella endophytica]|uniref:Uncharacterized protein n=1 Tax=Prauserella endophytica TaxID=1592324 RepID=A0ABY2RST6_9PSEU|nr:hypothetical protein [Prauserella endophytica]TKG58885.1 hypothetical protein FCN18_37350 [Prauserella endophytica]
MTLTIQDLSTEYIYIGVTGDVPSTGAEVAFKTAGTDPIEADWEPAILVNNAHALWADAVASGATGDYYVAILVGSFGGNTVAPAVGSYQVWLRLTDTTERPVRIAPEALVVA